MFMIGQERHGHHTYDMDWIGWKMNYIILSALS